DRVGKVSEYVQGDPQRRVDTRDAALIFLFHRKPLGAVIDLLQLSQKIQVAEQRSEGVEGAHAGDLSQKASLIVRRSLRDPRHNVEDRAKHIGWQALGNFLRIKAKSGEPVARVLWLCREAGQQRAQAGGRDLAPDAGRSLGA